MVVISILTIHENDIAQFCSKGWELSRSCYLLSNRTCQLVHDEGRYMTLGSTVHVLLKMVPQASTNSPKACLKMIIPLHYDMTSSPLLYNLVRMRTMNHRNPSPRLLNACRYDIKNDTPMLNQRYAIKNQIAVEAHSKPLCTSFLFLSDPCICSSISSLRQAKDPPKA